MARRKFWTEFEKYVGSKLPRDIPILLSECGYDSEFAILSLQEKDLETIEKEVNERKNILKSSSKYKNIYNSNERFVLKPGHKSLILSLPKKFEQFLEARKDKQRNNAEKRNETELKSELTEKLKKYMLSFSFNVNFTQSDLSEFIFVQDKNWYTCCVKCPFCMKLFRCKYSKYWITGNLESHLKKHVDDAKKITENKSDKNLEENRHVVPNPRLNLMVVSLGDSTESATTTSTTVQANVTEPTSTNV